jgi:hypothetical protein
MVANRLYGWLEEIEKQANAVAPWHAINPKLLKLSPEDPKAMGKHSGDNGTQSAKRETQRTS